MFSDRTVHNHKKYSISGVEREKDVMEHSPSNIEEDQLRKGINTYAIINRV
jgi:hypothetical protein